MGNSILGVTNLIDGVDWYSLSEYTFISTTKPLYAQKLPDFSTPVFLGGENAVAIGGTNGKVHILGLENFLGSLDHDGMYFPLYFPHPDSSNESSRCGGDKISGAPISKY